MILDLDLQLELKLILLISWPNKTEQSIRNYKNRLKQMNYYQSLQPQGMYLRRLVLMKRLKFGIMNYSIMIVKLIQFWM